MKSKNEAQFLSDCLQELEQAIGHINYSFNALKKIPTDLNRISEAELERIEAFTSRFARIVDLMINRVMRALDAYEIYDTGTLLDIAHRAEKRNLIDSVDWLREIKGVRNRIAHDYAGNNLVELVAYCRKELPRLIETCDRVIVYCKEKL